MKLRDAGLIALRGLVAHWARAALSAIGILAGVASVLLLVAVAQATGNTPSAAVEGLSPDLVVVYPGGVSSSGVQVAIGSSSSLTNDDVTALGNPGYVPDAVQAVPTAGVRANVSALSRIWQTDVLGSTTNFASARGYTLTEGRFFGTADVGAAASVVVLGQAVIQNLFAGIDPVGQSVHINKHPFTVIGVFAARGFSGTYNQDDLALMPITTAGAYVMPSGAPGIQQVLVQATSPAVASRVKTEATNTLLQRHHILNPANADFRVLTQHDLVGNSERLGTVMKWTLAAIAAIALFTGAVGITSFMLARVSERRHEIAVSRAAGAARSDILTQFFVEALLVACAGGLAGIAVGIAGTSLTANILTDLPAPTVTRTAVAVAAGVAIAVGAVAGYYPAMCASRLRPAER